MNSVVSAESVMHNFKHPKVCDISTVTKHTKEIYTESNLLWKIMLTCPRNFICINSPLDHLSRTPSPREDILSHYFHIILLPVFHLFWRHHCISRLMKSTAIESGLKWTIVSKSSLSYLKGQ